jgi:hypothetical protein
VAALLGNSLSQFIRSVEGRVTAKPPLVSHVPSSGRPGRECLLSSKSLSLSGSVSFARNLPARFFSGLARKRFDPDSDPDSDFDIPSSRVSVKWPAADHL